MNTTTNYNALVHSQPNPLNLEQAQRKFRGVVAKNTGIASKVHEALDQGRYLPVHPALAYEFVIVSTEYVTRTEAISSKKYEIKTAAISLGRNKSILVDAKKALIYDRGVAAPAMPKDLETALEQLGFYGNITWKISDNNRLPDHSCTQQQLDISNIVRDFLENRQAKSNERVALDAGVLEI